MAEKPVLTLHEIDKSFAQGGGRLHVLQSASLEIRPGEMVALIGPSGCGKSTLLNIAGLLEQPDRGAVSIKGKPTMRMGSRERARVRSREIGFVFQFHRLLPEFSARENIIIPQMLAGLSRKEAGSRADELLAMVGLQDRKEHRPGLLSGGEQQRVAIARGVSNAPGLLLADEPTGNLDPETAADVFAHLAAIIRSTGTAGLVVTHNTDLAARMDRVLTIRGGRIIDG
ncbi:MAG: ABC transporter ATP-binding protein [Candidatus Puniceispirillales bacterium]